MSTEWEGLGQKKRNEARRRETWGTGCVGQGKVEEIPSVLPAEGRARHDPPDERPIL